MRKLASIQRIIDIKPHSNADFLEIVIVNGWQCIVKKDEFKVDELIIYFEVDSVLPIKDEYEFLRKCCYVNKDWIEGFRLKTIKLRKELSQGLILPISIINNYESLSEGDDVTDILNVKKWEPPLPPELVGQAKSNFPTFIKKTDQERAQNLKYEIEKSFNNDDIYEVSIKLDGSSTTIYYNNGISGVCSRNIDLKINEENENNTFVKMYMKYKDAITTFCINNNRNLAFQGELIGPGIQGNREMLHSHDLYIFDIFDIDTQQYLPSNERLSIVKQLHLNHVPILNDLTNKKLPTFNINELLLIAEGKSLKCNIREGLVWKRIDGTFSFKTISNKYLLGEK